MHSRLAFTARPWGDSAVVCRTLEDRPGPSVVQEFGSFPTWTQANAFAHRLNEGLELDRAEARQIVTGSEILVSNLLPSVFPERPSPFAFARVEAARLCAEVILVELNVALAICRLLRTEPKLVSPHVLRTTHKALFNAVHFLLRSDLTTRELEYITAALSALHEVLQEIPVSAPPIPNPVESFANGG